MNHHDESVAARNNVQDKSTKRMECDVSLPPRVVQVHFYFSLKDDVDDQNDFVVVVIVYRNTRCCCWPNRRG
jgi:hypothetical protein